MTVQECYEQMGQDYKEVVERFGTESMLKKFVLRFLEEPSFAELTAAFEKGDAAQTFRAAHTLKGICLNLGFGQLYETSAALTEYLRNREDIAGADALFEEVQEAYDSLIDAIRQIQMEEPYAV